MTTDASHSHTNPHLHSTYATLCPYPFNSVVLYLGLALLSSYLVSFSRLLPVFVYCLSFVSARHVSYDNHYVPSRGRSSPPTPSLSFQVNCLAILPHFPLQQPSSLQCMISASSRGAFKPSPLHSNSVSLRDFLSLSLSVVPSSPYFFHSPSSHHSLRATCAEVSPHKQSIYLFREVFYYRIVYYLIREV